MSKKFNSIIFLGIAVLMIASSDTGAQDIFHGKTQISNPLDLRDPFKRKLIRKKTNMGRSKGISSGNYSNVSHNLENHKIDNLRVVGIIVGAERRALVRFDTVQGGEGSGGENQNNQQGFQQDVFYVKEGMQVGSTGAEVKAILPGGIVLVEKIRNVYDQDEYLETIIPISE